MKNIKNYRPSINSMSSGQVLHCPYGYEKTKLIVKEKNKIYLGIGKKTPWNNENIPPMPEEETDDLEEIIGTEAYEDIMYKNAMRVFKIK